MSQSKTMYLGLLMTIQKVICVRRRLRMKTFVTPLANYIGRVGGVPPPCQWSRFFTKSLNLHLQSYCFE